MPTIIHVNRNVLASNKKHGKADPAIIIRKGKERIYCSEVKIGEKTRMVQREDCPLDCGARVWLETEDEVIPIV